MEKRINKKDIILLSILGFIVLLIFLSMYMIDRQWISKTIKPKIESNIMSFLLIQF